MNNPDKDLMKIKRDALFAKKRLLDTIELLRQKGPSARRTFYTNGYYLTERTNIQHWDHFRNLLDAIMETGAVSFEVEDVGGNPWGEAGVSIKINDNFDLIAGAVREEYHNLNSQLEGEKKTQLSNGKNRWNYINPVWLIWQILSLASRYKIWSTVVSGLIIAYLVYRLGWVD